MTTPTLNRIEQLRQMALPLEPGAEQRGRWREQVIGYTDAFLESLPELPAFRATEDEGAGILESPISEAPIPVEQALDLLKNHVDRPGANEGTTPGFLAFIPSGGLYVSALADYIAAVTNRYMGVSFASPGAARLEQMVVRWMAGFVGYPATAAGDFTSGGSLANLSAIVTARDAHRLKAADYPRAVVYLSDQTHHSVLKGLRIAGMRECVVRRVPLDEHYRMRAEALEAAIRSDRPAGRLPWLVVATAGATDTGAVDPLAAIADIAGHNQLWLHVDGAYGAMFALCEMGKGILRGIERSDSLIMDPHKGMFLSLGTGAVLVRNGDHLRNAYRQQAHYLEDAETASGPDEVSPADLSPELTRPFRGLRLWLALKLTGVAPFRAALEEKLLLARHFHAELQRLDGFVAGPPPDLSVVTFRYDPRRGDANVFNQKLIQAIRHDGRIFLSSTRLNGQVVLRLAVLGFRTHLETIELALEILRQKAEEIENAPAV
jgi:glutamate/tyrosine decarboxylase-like PLP-dependent enzyme